MEELHTEFPISDRHAAESISDEDFDRVSRFIEHEYGIKMPATKKVMLSVRLHKRALALKMNSLKEYFEYLFSRKGTKQELIHMIDAVTTNKTGFFREMKHFDFLLHDALSELIRRKNNDHNGIERRILAWSAGCSSGEEPYSLAMVMSEYGERYTPFQFSIFGTDLSSEMLEKARLGIYDEMAVHNIPFELQKKYLLRSKDRTKNLFRIIPDLRAAVKFWRMNLMDRGFGLSAPLDILFCRNVVIYFDVQTQIRLFRKFYKCLNPGGYLFIGHSESLNGLNLPFLPLAPTIYQKPEKTA